MFIDSIGGFPQASGLAVRGLRYFPHARLRTKRAAEEAVRIAERVEASHGEREGNDGLDEQTLFTALHTCAFRAARRGRCKPVPRVERTAWARRWRLIRDFIVERNLGLAYSMMGLFRSDQCDWDELRSEAFLAIVRAVEGFNPWRGFRFSTYACNAIVRALAQETRKARKRRLRFLLGHDIRPETPERIDGGSELYADRLHRALELNLGELTARESRVLARRFPMNGGPGLTLGALGHTLGLSKERVRQIQNRALGKLREVLEADPVLQ